jgi:hypothetical protein
MRCTSPQSTGIFFVWMKRGFGIHPLVEMWLEATIEDLVSYPSAPQPQQATAHLEQTRQELGWRAFTSF